MDSETGLLTAGRDKTARVWSLHSQVQIITFKKIIVGLFYNIYATYSWIRAMEIVACQPVMFTSNIGNLFWACRLSTRPV